MHFRLNDSDFIVRRKNKASVSKVCNGAFVKIRIGLNDVEKMFEFQYMLSKYLPKVLLNKMLVRLAHEEQGLVFRIFLTTFQET